MSEILVPLNVLKAIRVFAATKDIRFYLNGVYLEIGKDESRVCATDGHMLGMYRIRNIEEQEPCSAIIPNDIIDRVKGKDTDRVSFKIEKGNNKVSMLHFQKTGSNTGTLVFDAIDGVFPDMRRVIPSEITGETAYFNPLLLSRVFKAAEILKGKNAFPLIGMNGECGSGVIDMNDENFMGVIMPYREDRQATIKTWAAEQI